MVIDTGASRPYPSPIDTVLIESLWRVIESIERVSTLYISISKETLSILDQVDIDSRAWRPCQSLRVSIERDSINILPQIFSHKPNLHLPKTDPSKRPTHTHRGRVSVTCDMSQVKHSCVHGTHSFVASPATCLR